MALYQLNTEGTSISTSVHSNYECSFLKMESSKFTLLGCLKKSSSSEAELAREQQMSICRTITESNRILASRVGHWLSYAYSMAKELILCDDFADTIVVSHIAENFDYENKFACESQANFNMQYLNSAFEELLEIIVECHKPSFQKNLSSARAISLRSDGSVDRTNIDKIYTMAKVVSEIGEDSLYFIGLGELEERGAKGLLRAITTGCENILGSKAKNVLRNSSSIVTDGATVNTGQKTGLWSLFDDKFKKLSEEEEENGVVLPRLLKIWCAVHR